MRHFISNHAKNHGISVILPLLITIAQELRLVGSHNTNLGAVAHSALELDVFQFGRCYFLSDTCVFGYIF